MASQTTSREDPIELLFAIERADKQARSSGCREAAEVGISCAVRQRRRLERCNERKCIPMARRLIADLQRIRVKAL